jgi:1-acyl-sn-glycerol-3-phosphate acyltransferase
MRLLYLIVKIFANYSLRIYFPRILKINAPKKLFGRTIYVSNHPSSFMDPIVVGTLQRPIVFFMTRSDIFTPVMKPILWLTQMLPIYRQLDGEGAVGKNAAVFKTTSNVLSFGRNLLIFGEGFTDDVFIRRLKPIKKGAARIGFSALDSMGWKKKVYVSCIGINYGDPKYLGSDVILNNSERFCLNDYEAMYRENPNKAITEVTRRIEAMMKPLITHVENKDWAPFHEQVSRIRRNGLNPEDVDLAIPLKKRFENSQQLANWINEQDLENPELVALKNQSDTYFRLQKRLGLKEKYVYELQKNGSLSTTADWIYLILMAPLFVLGTLHLGLIYILVKRMTEKMFKRSVFWSSVKMMLGMLLMALFNWPIVSVLNATLFQNGWIALVYFFTIPLFGVAAYYYKRHFIALKTKQKLHSMDLKEFVAKRKELEEKIVGLVKG